MLVQSEPLNIAQTVAELELRGTEGLVEGLYKVTRFAKMHDVKTYEDFGEKAGEELLGMMGHICRSLQDALKVAGDWKIYPFALNDLIAQGRVQIAGRTVYIDGKEMPEYGYRMDEYE